MFILLIFIVTINSNASGPGYAVGTGSSVAQIPGYTQQQCSAVLASLPKSSSPQVQAHGICIPAPPAVH